MSRLLFVSTFVASLGCAITGGVFFAFSTFVMPALARIPPARGIEAMQSINVTVINPAFMLAFLGSAVVGGLSAVLSIARWSEPASLCRIVATAIYLVGSVGVTMGLNVPLNDALAALPADGPAAAELWPRFLSGWTTWNHVRTAASLVAAALLMCALLMRDGSSPAKLP
jgi:uncharacterized membrane protein